MGLVSRLRNVRITRKLAAGFGIVLLLVALASAQRATIQPDPLHLSENQSDL